ncbi:MAG: hypothetical protein ACI4A3_00415 [Lachnospiraceae bacterium]
MRIVNGVIYVILIVCVASWLSKKGNTVFMEFVQRHLYLLALLFAVNSLSFAMTFQREDSQIYVEKEDYGGTEKQIIFQLEKEGDTEEVTLNVRPRKLKEEELEKRMQAAFKYYETHLKGENDSLEHVSKKLDIHLDYEEYPFEVEVQPENYTLIDEEGNIRNEESELLEAGFTREEIKEGIATSVTVILWYGEESRQHTYVLNVFPKEKSEKEMLFSSIEDKLSKEEKKAIYKEGFYVPVNMEGVAITKKDSTEITPFHVLLFGFIFTGLLLMREKEEERKKETERKQKLLWCYPWFVNEMVLLLGAGMQVKNIFQMLVKDYEKNGIDGTDNRMPLMEELMKAKRGFELGMPEEQIYYQLGRRLKLPCYIKLMTLLEQNVKKGGKGITAVFEQEEINALEERKNLAKRYGEEAGTKLLGPMILLLLVIMLMIMVPAFMSFA